MKRNYVIVGAGVAGITAAEAIRSKDKNGVISIIYDDPFAYYSRPGLAYYLAKEIPQKQLFPSGGKHLEELGVTMIHARATRIDPVQKGIELNNEQWIGYHRLLLATGALAVKPALPGVDLKGVFSLDNLSNAEHIVKLAKKSRQAVVIGGGITALEIVEGLIARKIKVHYFLRGDRFWKSILDETESRIVEKRLKEDGVMIHAYTEIDEILGKRGRVIGVHTKGGETIRCQMVGVAVGVRPRLELVQTGGLAIDRGVLVNAYLQAEKQVDIYAAGDLAQVDDPLTGGRSIEILWNPARAQGWDAGLNMTGAERPYNKQPAINITRLAGLTTTIIGLVGQGVDADLVALSRGDSDTWKYISDAFVATDDDDICRLRIMIGERYLRGALVMGDQTLSLPLQEIISHKVPIEQIRHKLLEPDAPIQSLIIAIWDQWRKWRKSAG